jgi:hypothetical protein
MEQFPQNVEPAHGQALETKKAPGLPEVTEAANALATRAQALHEALEERRLNKDYSNEKLVYKYARYRLAVDEFEQLSREYFADTFWQTDSKEN